MPYTHTTKPVGPVAKYPWNQLREIGDYFDVPPEAERGVRHSAYHHNALTGYIVRVCRLTTGSMRVVLVEIDPGAMAA